ncbi:MAG: biotin transporter BioY [Chlamydiia bacterium]|nr:biotin transporter BioY [Chlamydiia bacterium]
METFTESKSVVSGALKVRAWTAFQVILGSLFLSTCAQISIPFYPVPMTMQTLGVFILALMQGGRRASYSTFLYLALISLGLPLLSGGVSNSLWLALPTAGYLIGFPVAAFIIGKLAYAKERPSSWWIMMSILLGQMVIYTLGVGNLTRFLSFKQSVLVGLLPFLPLAGVKLLMATTFGSLWLRRKS